MLTPHELGIHSDSEHPQEAWELLKFMTGDEMAESFFKDNGHFSARKKDWENPDLMGDYPVYELAAEAMKEVSQYPLPWNLRGGEFWDVLSNGLQPVWLGDEGLETALPKTAQGIRAILEKPMAE
jgi:ABC-type glycerol-3-phosphate transport system substrate-binding protein